MTRKIDLIGQKFGCWEVMNAASRRKSATYWLCRCTCGTEKPILAANLVRGHSTSCGCKKRVVIGEPKKCSKCEIVKPFSEFYADRSKTISSACKVCRRKEQRAAFLADPDKRRERSENRARWAAKIRSEVINAYGGRCSCCGEARLVFLALDHIHGGGTKESDIIGNMGVYRKARREGFPKDKFQILCSNCNWAKHVTKGNCPHNEPSWMPPTWGGSIGMGV